MTTLSVDQALIKAKSYIKKNEIVEAKKLYQAVLLAFPKNVRIQKELASLNNHTQDNVMKNPPSETIDQLVNLYNQGQYEKVIKKAQFLTNQFSKSFTVWNILGASAAGIGMLDEAIKAFKKVILLKPNHVNAYYNMGNVLKDQGKLDEAIEAYNKAISLKPDDSDVYYNMGNVLQDQGKLDEAIEAYNKAISLKPDYAQAHCNMGVTLQNQGKLDEAINAYNKSISLKPDYAEAYSNMGATLQDQVKLDEAIEAYNKAISLKPDYAQAYSNMGVTLQEQGKLDEAIKACNKAISLKPDYADAYYNLGNVLKEQGKLDEAIEEYNKAISLKPDYADAYYNLGNVLKDQVKLDEAIEAYNKAISLKPDYAQAHSNMGVTLQEQGRVEEAIEACNKAISLEPDYADGHKNLSFVLLNIGKLQEGLNEYEWRWETKELLSQQRYFSQPLWNGKKSLNGKRILLWSEQGIGDTITWSSCLALVTSLAEHCILECPEKLVPLIERSFPNVEVKAVNKSLDSERDDFDFHLPMGSLYKHFIKDISQNPKIEPYLIPNLERVRYWKEQLKSLGNGPYIGISWKSSDMSPERIPNYSSIEEWSPILKIPNATFINLQYKDFENDLIKIKDEFGVNVHNFDDIDHFDDIDDVAALCKALDMVISNKTTIPFISGGVGTLTKLANWRQSSWNNILLNPMSSSVKIYERNTWEPWDNVFSSIAEDILKFKNMREANG